MEPGIPNLGITFQKGMNIHLIQTHKERHIVRMKAFQERQLLLKTMVAIFEQCILGVRSEFKHTPRSLIDDTNCKGIPESE